MPFFLCVINIRTEV